MKKSKTNKYDINNNDLFSRMLKTQEAYLNKKDKLNKKDQDIQLNSLVINEDALVNKEAIEEKVFIDKKTSKKKIIRMKFDENHILFNENGIKKLYDNLDGLVDKFDKINKSNAKQDFFSFEEDKADLKLNSFMHLIKSWHFNLYNKLEYKYFLNKLNDIGSKPAAKAFMNRLRKVYTGEETWESILNDKDIILNNIQDLNLNKQNEENEEGKVGDEENNKEDSLLADELFEDDDIMDLLEDKPNSENKNTISNQEKKAKLIKPKQIDSNADNVNEDDYAIFDEVISNN